MLVKEKNVGEGKECWAISGPNLTSSLVSPNHYAGNSLAFTAN